MRAWLIRNGQTPRLIELLWEPLAVAALNQSIDEAAAAPFAAVLRRMFSVRRRDSSLGLPTRPLDELYAASRPVRGSNSGGGEVQRQCARPHQDQRQADRARPRRRAVTPGSSSARCPGTRSRRLRRSSRRRSSRSCPPRNGLPASPIVTVNLWFDRVVTTGHVRRPARPDHAMGVRQADDLRRGELASVARLAARADAIVGRTTRS